MTAIGCQRENPNAPRLVRRIVVQRRPHSFLLLKCLAKMEMVLGLTIFLMGVLLNFLLYVCISYCAQEMRENRNGKSDELSAPKNGNHGDDNSVRNLSSAKFFIFFGIDGNTGGIPVKCNDNDAVTFTALMLCTYLISLYGVTLFWTNYHLSRGLSPKKYYSFLTKWIMFKASLLIGVLIVLEFFAGKLKTTINGLYLVTFLYCLYGLVLTCGLYQKGNEAHFYVRRVVPKKRATVNASADCDHYDSSWITMQFIPFDKHTGKFIYKDKNLFPPVRKTCGNEPLHLNAKVLNAACEEHRKRQDDFKIDIN